MCRWHNDMKHALLTSRQHTHIGKLPRSEVFFFFFFFFFLGGGVGGGGVVCNSFPFLCETDTHTDCKSKELLSPGGNR